MPIVVSYNDLGLLGGLAVQAGQAQGQINDKNYYRQRQMRDESMLLQDSLNKPGGMPVAQFGAQPAPRPGGITGTVMDAANQPQARIVQKTPVAPVGGSVNLGEQELAKNMAKETAKIEADKQELKVRQDEIKKMVDSGVINQSRGDELINAYYNERYGFNPKDQAGGRGQGIDVKPINAEEQIGYAIGQTRRWDQLGQVNKENIASGFRSTKSAAGKNTSVLAGVEKYFQTLSTDEFFKMWADGDYPPELTDFMDQEYQRRLKEGRASIGRGQAHNYPADYGSQNDVPDTGQLDNNELRNQIPALLKQAGIAVPP